MTKNLADEYAALKVEIEALTKSLDAVKAQIKATGSEIIEGDHATVTVGLSERTSIDAKAVKLILTPEQFASVSKTTLVETLRLKIKLAAAKAA